MLVSGTSHAAVTEYSTGSLERPTSIAAGPKDQIVVGGLGSLATVTGSGRVSAAIIPAACPPELGCTTIGGVAFAPDGSVWSSLQRGGIVRRDPAGRITAFPFAPELVYAGTSGVAVSPTGIPTAALANEGAIAGLDVGTSTFSQISLGLRGRANFFSSPAIPVSLAYGRDSRLWVTDLGADRILAINGLASPLTGPSTGESGVTSVVGSFLAGGSLQPPAIARSVRTQAFNLPDGAAPWGVAIARDGAVWFTEQNGNAVGRIGTDGQIKRFRIPTPEAVPRGIAAGPDGAMWFTEFGANQIGRVDAAGKIREYRIPTRNAGPQTIAAGAGNAMWFTEMLANKVGRIDVRTRSVASARKR